MASMNEVISIDRLPAMPVTLARALPILLDPKGGWDELERVVRQDQALTGFILRLANSARYGSPGRQFDLRSSMSRLGRDTLRWAVLQQQVSSLVMGENAAYGLCRGEMWRSSLAGAFAAEELARLHAANDVSLAFVCGLLRDIGKLALDAAYGGGYQAALAGQGGPERSFIDAERAALGFDHAQVGGALARKWNLPERIAVVVESHHLPPPLGSGHDVLCDVVHAADAVCRWAGLGVGDDGMEYTLATHVRVGMGLNRPTVERLVALVHERLTEAEASMDGAINQGVAA
jgi:putative nucleotidyltransferase with HDIG domain